MRRYFYASLLILLASGCAPGHADGTRAQLVASPISGYTCFAIMNGDGQPVGGNCVRD